MAVDVPTSVIVKLMFFTLAMVSFPVLTFFVSQQYTSNTLVNGGLAALAANVVLFAYVIMAFSEDVPQSDGKESKKQQ
ncbi:AAR096Wp [Eremothecium gossypii ATCC 10895]|uniref:Vacuolar ATPase assembly integral membrane protein VMA21 n=1 Tax=Eremothecium gossypii (strain ATCC 10895 / CBS 109.51 / FGSC 9923 / NRRL Y-1056) TaxID=284811 RepID=VMA21_EREGS|nr:AAR096Wp [Eremothecium gossypii ATCC 10895]Q75EI3.1 RecName: Full=Vacuolar ATPase assembly integral membrane protein VMA21 [Eremothecium gossypii ATCC 10895]AAS50461.1 AAR096Wp [Eremothecium gossypii ATCC 10895]AEY94747.1 FAAR096Wp [Eremothecium gossypii FDAG1]